ncbi:rhomboid-like protein 14, mitochondrial [Curcuma longa]|uniref:rhomboid-like protein 14, mitochondrial n=1 Tax=Curcuma longa TaxID=136217 RepID=UPI003D9DD764
MSWYYFRSRNHNRDGGAWGRMTKGMLPLLALQVASEFHRLGRKPPVTAGLLLANTIVYIRPSFLDRLLPTIHEVSFNPNLILKYGDLKRFFLSPFYHLDDAHLFYNMTSLLWKGIQLETSMDSLEFVSMVAILLGMSQGITLLMARSLLIFFGYERAYYTEYAVGFSGVLFALKVVLNAYSDEYTYVHSMVIPTRYAAWAELILIQVFVPGVSFMGHLGGILAGLLYLKLRSSYRGLDPLSALVRKAFGVVFWPLRFVKSIFSFPRRRILGGGRVGSTRPGFQSGVWRCDTCTYDNSMHDDVCEMCSTPRQGNGFSQVRQSNPSNNNLSVEELRLRRLERFG